MIGYVMYIQYVHYIHWVLILNNIVHFTVEMGCFWSIHYLLLQARAQLRLRTIFYIRSTTGVVKPWIDHNGFINI